MDKHTGPETLLGAITYFADPDRALAYMVGLRWPDGVTCPTCGGTVLPVEEWSVAEGVVTELTCVQCARVLDAQIPEATRQQLAYDNRHSRRRLPSRGGASL